LAQLVSGGSNVTLTASDIEIGAVEIKNATDDTRALVATAAPGVNDPGLVVRVAGGGSGDGAILDGVSAAIKATVFDRTNSNPLAAQLVDSNGDPVSVGGGTQYAEDTATAAGEQLTMAGVVRRDAQASLVDADGDRTELQVNSTGALRTDGSGATQPISAASLPLPTGAATEATLSTLNGKVTAVDTGAVTISTALPAGNNNIGDVDVASLPSIPAGTNNIGDVDVLTVPAPLNVSGGGAEATALRVTLANDSTGLVSVDDNGASLTVDVGTALPAGANNIGDVDVLTLPSIPAGTNNIGDVDVLTVPAPLSTTGGGTEATALRVTLANDSTGVVSVDDNGAALTVDNGGTFAVQDSEKVTDNNAFTDGTTKVQPAGYVFDEVAGTALTENDAAAARIDSKRAQVLVIEDATTRGQRATVTAANAVKVDGSAVTQPVSVAATLNVIPKNTTSGGHTTFHLVSAATTNATVVKASAGQLYGWYIYNSNASARKLAFHNSSSSPTAGASIFFTLVIPPTSGANVFSEIGIPFSSGIAITTVTGLADSDNTAVAANDLVINLWYA
jgi:hypothetical protein